MCHLLPYFGMYNWISIEKKRQLKPRWTNPSKAFKHGNIWVLTDCDLWSTPHNLLGCGLALLSKVMAEILMSSATWYDAAKAACSLYQYAYTLLNIILVPYEEPILIP